MFIDRKDAGKRLAEKLRNFTPGLDDAVVLGIPRGGVPVAAEVAMALHVPMGVFIVRKIGVPGQPEFAMGAIASGGGCYLNQVLIRKLGLSKAEVESVISEEQRELERRERVYAEGQPAIDLKNRRVILVDDGVATGASLLVAMEAIRAQHPAELIVAVPVMAGSCVTEIESKADLLVYVLAPDDFCSVGQWYQDFAETSDEEVRQSMALVNAAS